MNKIILDNNNSIAAIDDGCGSVRELLTVTAIPSKQLVEYIKTDCVRTVFGDAIECVALQKPDDLQQIEDLFRNCWDEQWLTDGLSFQRQDGGIVIGEEATDNNGNKEGWIYNPMLTIRIK